MSTLQETIRQRVAALLSIPSKLATLRRTGRVSPIWMPPFGEGFVFVYTAEGRLRCAGVDLGPLPPDEPQLEEWPEPEGTWFSS